MDTSSIIDRLGGTKQTAQLCGVSVPSVSDWRKYGIPPVHWRIIVHHATDHGIDGVTWDAVQSARQAHKFTKKKPAPAKVRRNGKAK